MDDLKRRHLASGVGTSTYLAWTNIPYVGSGSKRALPSSDCPCPMSSTCARWLGKVPGSVGSAGYFCMAMHDMSVFAREHRLLSIHCATVHNTAVAGRHRGITRDHWMCGNQGTAVAIDNYCWNSSICIHINAAICAQLWALFSRESGIFILYRYFRLLTCYDSQCSNL